MVPDVKWIKIQTDFFIFISLPIRSMEYQKSKLQLKGLKASSLIIFKESFENIFTGKYILIAKFNSISASSYNAFIKESNSINDS